MLEQVSLDILCFVSLTSLKSDEITLSEEDMIIPAIRTSSACFTELCVCMQVQKYKAIAEHKPKNGTEEVGSTDDDDLQNGLDPHILDLQSKIHH